MTDKEGLPSRERETIMTGDRARATTGNALVIRQAGSWQLRSAGDRDKKSRCEEVKAFDKRGLR